MNTVRMLARCEIRRRWRSTVALVLLVGAVGAVILATAAGARRSDTALARFNAYSGSADVEMSIGPTPTASELRTFAHAPGVAAMAVLHAYALNVKGYEDANLAIAAPVDSALGTVVDRARLISGRRTDPSAPDEITIGESFAAQKHLRIGDHLDASSYTVAQIVAGFSGKDPGPPAGPSVRFRVVGIERRPLDLGDRAASGGVVVLTPAFNRAYAGRIGLYTAVLRVRTQHGAADVPRVVAASRKLWGKQQTYDVQGLDIEAEGALNAIDVLTQALWIFAGVAALAGSIAIGIVLSRDIAHGTLDPSTLRALGATRGQRVATSGARALLIAGGGALLAGVGALWLSPLFPLGVARRADPDVGLHADWLVLAIGMLAVAVAVLAIAFFAAWRATRPARSDRLREARRRPSAVVELAARSGLRPTATNGLRMALQSGSGDSAVPVRSAFAGAIFGIAGIAAVLVFAASLGHLVATPRLSGWTWNLQLEVPTTPGAVCADANSYGISHVPGVEAVSGICFQNIQVGGRPVTGWGFRSFRGSITPEVVAGRAPRGAREVALGAVTLRALHKHIGDTVSVHGPNGTREFSIVGRIVLPTITGAQPLADGASFTNAGLVPLLQAGQNQTHFVLVRMAPGADPAVVTRRFRTVPQIRSIPGETAAVEVKRLEQINWFPAILATLLATLALAAVGHALVTSVRRRRREVALLKTIGFGRRQVGAMIAWQATTLAVVGIVVGIPIGILAGRAVWRAVADGLGIATGATLPTWWLALTAVAALALVNLIAFFPARSAARTPPAVALRSE